MVGVYVNSYALTSLGTTQSLRHASVASILPGAGLEPARGRPRGIFIPTTAFAAARGCGGPQARIWSLDFIFTMPGRPLHHLHAARGLGGGRQVSTLSATLELEHRSLPASVSLRMVA